MNIQSVRTVLLSCVLSAALRVGLTAGETKEHVPWWDDFPTMIQVSDPRTAALAHATAALCGAADDPTWGIFGQASRAQIEERMNKRWVEETGLGLLKHDILTNQPIPLPRQARARRLSMGKYASWTC